MYMLYLHIADGLLDKLDNWKRVRGCECEAEVDRRGTSEQVSSSNFSTKTRGRRARRIRKIKK